MATTQGREPMVCIIVLCGCIKSVMSSWMATTRSPQKLNAPLAPGATQMTWQPASPRANTRPS
eukprot:1069614-Lingulodinium_polyedra.AAC.1